MTELETLKQKMLADSAINNSALAKSARQLVFGRGNPQARLMLVGEAPGAQEDRIGKPFVGAAGNFLHQALKACQVAWADIWITNLVKFRPPANRDPLPEEKALHTPYLRREISLVKPRWLITLGRHAGLYFAPYLRLSSDHGRKVTTYQAQTAVDIYAFYHPAAALYNPALKAIILNDFQQFFKEVNY